MRKVLLAVGAALVVLLALALVRTALYRPTRETGPAPAVAVAVPAGAAERLSAALRIRTISHEDPAAFDAGAFRALHDHLRASFPRVHAHLRRETVGAHSLLYTWTGADPSLRPILLVGHLDVVPVEPGTEPRWQEDPFGGRIADGFVWGRGAIDNKSTVLGTLEAVEMLLGEDWRPARTVLLAYGHDEEVGGLAGARQIAALLERRGVALEMVLDEGGVIGDGILPGVATPVALVGIAEKGFVSVELSTRAPGGHSSVPGPGGAIGVLGAAVGRLEDEQLPARFEGPTRQLFERLGPWFPFGRRAVFANLWLTRPLLLRGLASAPATNAMVRTTTAATIFQAGTKDNVLPSHARAVINFRILPGDSIAAVVAHVRRVVDDERVQVRIVGRFSAEPSAVSSTGSPAYRALARTIRRAMPEAIVAPYLMVGVTDARHYAGLSRNVFRFQPLRLTQRDLARMHGTDERVTIGGYERAISIYRQLILESAGVRAPPRS